MRMKMFFGVDDRELLDEIKIDEKVKVKLKSKERCRVHSVQLQTTKTTRTHSRTHY